ncbi:MAG: carbamate kinase, partial [Deltaproteobacteria bacterium]|nr:carbamate kinase [Deltaproteobacteria bacterium]
YRRVVASPEPLTIVEKNEIMRLIEMDFVVVCCGGGGIPVVREGRSFAGVDAVIDKDLASARLACEVGVEIFVIATDVSGVAVGYGTPGQRFLDALTIEQATKYMERGEFPEGSMLPKIRAAVDFLEAGGSRAFITSIETIEDAVAGRSGTEILRGSPRP